MTNDGIAFKIMDTMRHILKRTPEIYMVTMIAKIFHRSVRNCIKLWKLPDTKRVRLETSAMRKTKKPGRAQARKRLKKRPEISTALMKCA